MNASEVKIYFTVEQVNALLARLGQLPYAQVADLVEGIKSLASAQLPAEEPQDQKEAA